MKNIGNFWRLPFEICPATPLNSEGELDNTEACLLRFATAPSSDSEGDLNNTEACLLRFATATSSDSEGGPEQHGEKVESKAQKEK